MDDETETGHGDFWTRMRRRKVVQWSVAYAAGAWGLLQGLAYVTATTGPSKYSSSRPSAR